MSGASAIMSVILLETAVGASFVLWASGVWGGVRRGFFLLTGTTAALSALGAWALIRAFPQVAPASAALVGGFALLAVAWQILLLTRASAAARLVGLAATAVGIVALVVVGLAREPRPLVGVAELVLGAVFLGSTVHGLLLGHWYLVERRLTNRYMVDSAWWYVGGVAAGAAAVALSAQNPPPETIGLSPFLAVPGFSVLLAAGLVAICALIAGFVWKLAREGGRSIQAATGMFYLAVIMAFSAELSSKVRFFAG